MICDPFALRWRLGRHRWNLDRWTHTYRCRWCHTDSGQDWRAPSNSGCPGPLVPLHVESCTCAADADALANRYGQALPRERLVTLDPEARALLEELARRPRRPPDNLTRSEARVMGMLGAYRRRRLEDGLPPIAEPPSLTLTGEGGGA
jgi:hypothetical protein